MAQINIEKFNLINVGELAPAFAGKTIDGHEIKLADLKGKVVLIDFWATWCTPCLAEMPNIRKAYDKYASSDGFVVIGISLDEDPKSVARLARSKNIPWPQIVLGPAEKNEIAKLYCVASIPATFLIDRHGKVVAKDLRGGALERELSKLLNVADATASAD